MIRKHRKSALSASPPADAFTLETPTTTNISDAVFLNSVEMLSEQDIPAAAPQKKKPWFASVRNGILVLFATSFLISCGFLIKDAFSKQKANEIYSDLRDQFFSQDFQFNGKGETTPSLTNPAIGEDDSLPTLSDQMQGDSDQNQTIADQAGKYNEDLQKMRAGLASLAQINPDIYGWISVEGTQINYPLVQGEDNDFYLDHAYTGEYLPEGAIFADYRNDSTVTNNRNTVFYGHNLRTGGMFHDVIKFANAAFMASTKIYVYTFDGVFIYQPFAFYESRYDYQYFKTGFASDEEFLAFANEYASNSAVQVQQPTFDKDSRLLTLSTCTNGYYTQRYALHAVLVEVITDELITE